MTAVEPDFVDDQAEEDVVDIVTHSVRERPRWLGGLIGFTVLIVLWQLASSTILSGPHSTVPAPTTILAQMAKDGWSFYWPNIVTTTSEAGWGWLWGNLLAIVLALVFVQLPLVEKGLLKLAVAIYCLPIIAIGPILQIIFKGSAPKIILAALSVFFTTLIGALVGLRSADQTSLDVVHAYGGTSVTQMRRVRMKASLPSLFAGLRIAAPAAFLGAIIGEYMGGENGLGIAMINSEQSLQIARTWGIALVATALAGLAYAATALVERLMTPWAPRSDR